MRVINDRAKNLHPELKRILDRGIIAAIPTDTVYGLVTSTGQGSILRLARLKGREKTKFAVFLPNKEKINELAMITNKTQKCIINDLLPGRVTLVLKQRKEVDFAFGGKVGIRIPGLEWLSEFLRYYKQPIVVTSANQHDEPPLRNVYELKKIFPDLKLIVDGGEIDGRASTVVDLTQYPPFIRRLGSLPIFEVEKAIKRNVRIDQEAYFSILVVCTGNACRSPMAVGILKGLLKGLPVFVYSAGTVADIGLPAADNAIVAAQAFGADISNHQSQPLSKELILRSDLILVMQNRHRKKVLELDPEAGSKTFMVKDFPKDHGEIFDPIGGMIEVYRKCLKLMMPGLERVVQEIRKRYQ